MKKITSYLFFLLVVFTLAQCDDGLVLYDEPETLYGDCCGTDSVEFHVGNARIYVPNVFTVNGDGINDLFFPFFNDKVAKAELFQISNSKLVVMHLAKSVDLQNPAAQGWDGKDPDGKIYAGQFRYALYVTDDTGFTQAIHGTACSIVCDTSAHIFKTKEGCYFSTQHDGNGGLDPSLPSFEGDCFDQ